MRNNSYHHLQTKNHAQGSLPKNKSEKKIFRIHTTNNDYDYANQLPPHLKHLKKNHKQTDSAFKDKSNPQTMGLDHPERGAKWRGRKNLRKPREKLERKESSINQSEQKTAERAAEHRRITSSFKISERVRTMSSIFSPEGKKLKKSITETERNMVHEQNPFKIFQRSRKVKEEKKNSILEDFLDEERIETSMKVIKEVEEMRKTVRLKPNPKQWQFHNCLTLQKIELYQTNLRISCEAWIAIDHLELKYLRGWNPKTQDDFTPLVRLFLFLSFMQLHEKKVINMDTTVVRVNPKHVQTIKSHQLGVSAHSIVSIRKLLYALTITHYEDLLIHLILALGHILKLTKQSGDEFQSNVPAEIYIKSSERSLLESYYDLVEDQCKQICFKLKLDKTVVVLGRNCLKNPHKPRHMQYFLTSTPLDIAVLFMKCLAYKELHEILATRIYEPQYRFQVGWNFWETRTAHWVNKEYVKYRFRGIAGRTLKENECIVVWDEKRNLVIVAGDCKVNMHWKDVERVQAWIDGHVPRFSKQYALNLTSYPTDTQKFYRIK